MARVAWSLSVTKREMEGQWLVYYSAVYNLCSPLIQYKKSWFVRDLITIKSVSLFKDKANIIYNIYCIGALSLQVKAGGPSLPLPKGYKLGGPSCAVIEYSCLVRVPWALVYFRFIFTIWIVLWVAWIPHDPGGHRFGRPSGESGVQGDEFLLVKSLWSRPWPDTLGLFPQTQGGVHGRPRRCCVQSSAWVGLCSTRALRLLWDWFLFYVSLEIPYFGRPRAGHSHSFCPSEPSVGGSSYFSSPTRLAQSSSWASVGAARWSLAWHLPGLGWAPPITQNSIS